VFEHFTDRARAAVVHAAQEATALDHHYIGTEHLLLGLLRDDTATAFRILRRFDISFDNCRASVEEMVGRGEGPGPSCGQLPYTPRAKKVLELSLRESRGLEHRGIGTDHMLLALLREGEGVAAQILTRRGVTLEAVEEAVRREQPEEDAELGEDGDPPVA
jgi:ATP-dependent Clp protease ATP-binding subunit ClpC